MNNKNKWLFGPRKTTDKPVSDMGMYELALNNCYIKERQAYYRDFGEYLTARELVIGAARTLECESPFEDCTDDDEYVDNILCDWGVYGVEEPEGILALLYSLLWSKAELYEKLNKYEDAEERGEIGRAPRWIPVTERMPEEEGFCLAAMKNGVVSQVAVSTNGGRTYFWYSDSLHELTGKYAVTHWMPLPDAPEVE